MLIGISMSKSCFRQPWMTTLLPRDKNVEYQLRYPLILKYMITTDKFVLVHMHKTGGQSLGRIVADCIPGMKQIGYHYPYKMLPAEDADKPVVGMVRNPWDWYISWYMTF